MSQQTTAKPNIPETITVDTEKLYCDGTVVTDPADTGALGHPRVFLTINKQGFVDCPYCDRHYVLVGSIKNAAH